MLPESAPEYIALKAVREKLIKTEWLSEYYEKGRQLAAKLAGMYTHTWMMQRVDLDHNN